MSTNGATPVIDKPMKWGDLHKVDPLLSGILVDRLGHQAYDAFEGWTRELQDKWIRDSQGELQARKRNIEHKAAELERAKRAAVEDYSITWASDMSIRATHWLWDERIPVGELALLAGREGIGKSTVIYTLAAWITSGDMRGEFYGTPRNVLVSATEDDWARTILPRLMAAGADTTRVARIEIPHEGGLDRAPDLPTDLLRIRKAIKDTDAALVIFDPIISRLSGGLDTHRDADVRQALEPVVSIAHDTGAAVLGIIHVNKSGSTDALNNVMGSKAFAAVARAVLYCLQDPDDESLKILGQPKNNLGRSDLKTYRYRIVGDRVGVDDNGDDVWTSKLDWAESTSQSVGDFLQATVDGGEQDDAGSWLLSYLESVGGSKASGIIRTAAREAGHGESSIKRARKRLGITFEYDTSVKPMVTVWHLPDRSLVPSSSGR